MRLLAIVCLAIGFADRADASPITFNFTGTLTSVDQKLSPGLAVGEAVSGTVMYDRDHGINGLPPSSYLWSSITWTIDGYAFSVGGSGGYGASGVHHIEGFSPLTGAVTFFDYFSSTPLFVAGDGYNNAPDRFTLGINPSTDTGFLLMAFTSYSSTGPSLGTTSFAEARIDAVTPVPEPSTFVLVASTIGFALRRRLRRSDSRSIARSNDR